MNTEVVNGKLVIIDGKAYVKLGDYMDLEMEFMRLSRDYVHLLCAKKENTACKMVAMKGGKAV